ncbi:hypothetical protein LOK49_LG06G02945 [Camellia lanceoleosa]|uniref:Uncharacterized protein n=1 Tax=Camellia lanceoleosa TaxID=1840588 RepID=A0ACC0HGM3_9ERIC|nr:hypothetical protein LOK49_LG06G02945 [Camellia lanceoleosa]
MLRASMADPSPDSTPSSNPSPSSSMPSSPSTPTTASPSLLSPNLLPGGTYVIFARSSNCGRLCGALMANGCGDDCLCFALVRIYYKWAE